jgi:hypothetical protein
MFKTGNSNPPRVLSILILVLITFVFCIAIGSSLYHLGLNGSGLDNRVIEMDHIVGMDEEILVFVVFAPVVIGLFSVRLNRERKPIHTMISAPQSPPPKTN